MYDKIPVESFISKNSVELIVDFLIWQSRKAVVKILWHFCRCWTGMFNDECIHNGGAYISMNLKGKPLG